MWRQKYYMRIDEVSNEIKEHLRTKPLSERFKNIIDEARKLKEEFEEDYRAIIERKNQSRWKGESKRSNTKI
jgi:hypothetical protein